MSSAKWWMILYIVALLRSLINSGIVVSQLLKHSQQIDYLIKVIGGGGRVFSRQFLVSIFGIAYSGTNQMLLVELEKLDPLLRYRLFNVAKWVFPLYNLIPNHA